MNVLILGLGQYPKGSGVAAALFYAKRGDEVVVTDMKPAHELRENVDQLKKFMNVRFHLGKHDLDDIRRADLIVRHQRVRDDSPEMRLARSLGKEVTSEIALFLELCPATVIGITGTRGKSTTSALTYALLKEGERRVWLGGNILISPLTFLSKIKKDDVVVLELSSWQLEGMGQRGRSPQIAVWTNLMRDHLNTYSGMDEYAEAKAQIFRHQNVGDLVFLPADAFFHSYAKEAPGRVYRFGKKDSRESVIIRSVEMRLLGEHNKRNAEIATAVALEMGIPVAAIKRVLRTFKGLPHRLEIVAEKQGVRFINDTTATTPDGTRAAIEALSDKRLHLIFGGADKELEFDAIAKTLKKHRVIVALLPGTAHAKIVKAFRQAGLPYQNVDGLPEAMAYLAACVKKGDVILLSPGCASFGLFKNEFDRGEQFTALAKTLRL
jgi:UDP-N-acetylmuramoylalanine--D-glutamate ligase